MRILFCFFFLTGWLAAEPQVKARLLADQTAVVPGGRLRLGVLLEPAEHWHTYWKNAGDSGLPSEFSWKLPKGWSPGPLLWPLPGRFEVMGSVLYGYDQAALHQMTLRLPAGLKPGQKVTLGVEASWLACNEEACVPGKAELQLVLPVAARAVASAEQARFDAVQAPLAGNFKVSRSGQELLLETDLPLAQGVFFPDPGLQIVDAAPQKAEGPPLRLRLQAAPRTKALTRLQGLLVVGEGKARRGYMVDQPVP
ncbi:MAG: hypothetical protein KF760_34700 [Candidatus Eremiobacteraeota bacterium]|nr:hypothetical protein [Candidatus Eremiobacteraeota bacterium]MCW5868415.1 hypothetical protein [Candidatus Eremiobacteraeota bacterium]